MLVILELIPYVSIYFIYIYAFKKECFLNYAIKQPIDKNATVFYGFCLQYFSEYDESERLRFLDINNTSTLLKHFIGEFYPELNLAKAVLPTGIDSLIIVNNDFDIILPTLNKKLKYVLLENLFYVKARELKKIKESLDYMSFI